MESFNTWALTYTKLFGIIAAVIVLGSWLVENIIVERVTKYRDSITRAEDDKATTERFFHIESKLLEVYQVAASARKYSAQARNKEHRTFLDDLNEDIELLERTGVTRNFAYAFAGYSGRTEDFLSAINPPSDITNKVKKVTSKINELRTQLDERRENYKQAQKAIVGNGDVINPNTITEEQVKKLSSIIREYRNDVEFNLGPQLTPAANDMFRAYDALFEYARQELRKRESLVTIVWSLQIFLYILGSIIAIYSSYLEAIHKGTL